MTDKQKTDKHNENYTQNLIDRQKKERKAAICHNKNDLIQEATFTVKYVKNKDQNLTRSCISITFIRNLCCGVLGKNKTFD